MNDTPRPFSTRAATSLVAALSFLTLAFTGIVLYCTPQGRVAHWTHWTFLGLDKEQWGAVHIVVSALFLLTTVLHTYLNWGALMRYLKNAGHQGFRAKRELLTAVVLTSVCAVGAVALWPPFGYLIDGTDAIKDYWEGASAPAPYPHVEDSTLAQFAERQGIEPEELLRRLHDAGFESADLTVTIGALSRRHNLSPAELLKQAGLTFGTGQGEGQGAQNAQGQPGAGWGRKSLGSLCAEEGVDVSAGIEALRAHGITARPDDTLRDLADQAGVMPHDVAEWIRAGGQPGTAVEAPRDAS